MTSNSPIRSPQPTTLRSRLRDWALTDTRGLAICATTVLAVFWVGIMAALTSTHHTLNTLAPTPTTPTPATTTTTPVPTPSLTTPTDYPSTPFGITATPTTPKAPTNDDGPTPTDEQAAQAVAERFATAWLAGPTATSQQAWLNQLKPATSPTFLKRLALARRSTVPTTELKGVAAETKRGTMSAYFLTTSGNRYNLTLVRDATNTSWRVNTLTSP